MSSLGRMAATATLGTRRGRRATSKCWLLCQCLAVTLIAGTLTSFGVAVVTNPEAGKYASNSGINPCKVLPDSDISAIIGARSTHQIILDLNTYACGWTKGPQKPDVAGPPAVAIVERSTEINYAEAGVSVSPVAGLPANLVVFSATALQPNLVARAHVQFSVPIKGPYWEVQGEMGSNAQLEKLARALYAALGGVGQTPTTIQGAGQKEASDVKQFIADIRAESKAENQSLCGAISGGTCSGGTVPAVVATYVQQLQTYQSRLGAALTIVEQQGRNAESVGNAARAAQLSISGLRSSLSEAEASDGPAVLKGQSGAPSKIVQAAVTDLEDLSSLLIAKEEQLSIRPSPTSESSAAAGL
jgi:hypothetical protein